MTHQCFVLTFYFIHNIQTASYKNLSNHRFIEEYFLFNILFPSVQIDRLLIIALHSKTDFVIVYAHLTHEGVTS
jgi:hypothetical protein